MKYLILLLVVFSFAFSPTQPPPTPTWTCPISDPVDEKCPPQEDNPTGVKVVGFSAHSANRAPTVFTLSPPPAILKVEVLVMVPIIVILFFLVCCLARK